MRFCADLPAPGAGHAAHGRAVRRGDGRRGNGARRAARCSTTTVADRDDACAVLMRGIVQLPDYLERLQGGHKDIPIVLLPLLNDLRAARGEKGLSESVLFSPDLSRPLPPQRRGPGPRRCPSSSCKPLRRAPAHAVPDRRCCSWLKDAQTAESTSRALLGDARAPGADHVAGGGAPPVLGRGRRARRAARRRPSSASASAEAGVRQGRARDQAPRRRRRSRVPRRPAARADQATCCITSPTRASTPAASASCARRPSSSPSLAADRSRARARRGSLDGRNRALLDTVSAAIKEDLLRVKDALDLHLRTPDRRRPTCRRRSKRSTASPTRSACSAWACRAASCWSSARSCTTSRTARARRRRRAARHRRRAALRRSLARRPGPQPRPARATGEGADGRTSCRRPKSRKVLEALVKEAQANFAQARQSFVAFVETNWDHAKLREVPRLLDEVAGALRILDLPQPAEYLHAHPALHRGRAARAQARAERPADGHASPTRWRASSTTSKRCATSAPDRDRILDVDAPEPGSAGLLAAAGRVGAEELVGAALEAGRRHRSPSDEARRAKREAPSEAPDRAPRFQPPKVDATRPFESNFDPAEIDLQGLSFETDTSSPSAFVRRRAGTDRAVRHRLRSTCRTTASPRTSRGSIAANRRATQSSATSSRASRRRAELSSIVEIAPGSDLSGLLVGDRAAHPVVAAAGGPRPGCVSRKPRRPHARARHDDDFDWVEIEEEVEIDAPARSGRRRLFQAVPSDDIDDEIREVFVEEVAGRDRQHRTPAAAVAARHRRHRAAQADPPRRSTR